MLGLTTNIFWITHRIKINFADDIGNEKFGCGTGFWMISQSGKNIFVTNKHNVDPSIKFPNKPSLKLDKISIELRYYESSQPTENTDFFDVENIENCLFSSPSSDCSILVDPKFHKEIPSDPNREILKFENLIDEKRFANRLIIGPMETSFFIGFPGQNGRHWWDEKWKLPVARQCTVASLPQISFTNGQIKTDDIILMSGLSFSGSSGSPVFLPARGFPPGGDINDPAWRPALLAGIMSGHFWEETSAPSMFHHTGLSYMTRSTSILKLLQQANI
ncbi:hypothetical protein QT972_21130 [Microcoleus sp. herbarium7]|uniref:hypothetical protein n=1 Tax=Microcoleus sp. herbarium7 TaxID=3055435 RepID=UPI002FD0150D